VEGGAVVSAEHEQAVVVELAGRRSRSATFGSVVDTLVGGTTHERDLVDAVLTLRDFGRVEFDGHLDRNAMLRLVR
jgi:hypothetical protein